MGWQELKSVGLGVVAVLVILLIYVPWTTLIRWAKEEAKKHPKDVI